MDKYIGIELGNRYKIGELIGIGGMSNVYKAFDMKTNRVVAVKILRDEYLTNPEFLKRFKNESKALTAIASPNIVNVYDVSFNETSQWIVMEYIDGITLKEYVQKKKVLNWQESIYFTVQILRALQHAHDRGIVHRDIKPQNIMLLKDGTVKVMDFGIARFARNDNKTMTDKAIGSVHYISPEQAKGANIDEKTDIYSVGVMLFEMVTGRLPFDADNPVSVALKQIQLQPLRPKQVNPMVPTGIDQIIMKSMQKDPKNRYQSAAEMLNDLLAFRQNPSKVFNYENSIFKNRNLQANELSNIQPNKLNTNKLQTNSKNNSKNQMSWIKMLMVISCIIFFMTLAIVGGALFLSGIFNPTKNITVPDLLGENYELIKDEPEYSKFNIQLVTTEYSEKYATGEICEQTPKAGRLVKEHTKIEVKVSKGQKNIKMPDIVNKEIQTAISELKNLGLNAKIINIFDDEIEKDIVIKTEPAAESNILLGSEVTIYVSSGAENKEIKVPDLNKFSLESAQKMLEDMKLQLGAVSYVNSDQPKDVVLRQNPAPGQAVELGEAVDVQVSSGEQGAKRCDLKVDLPDMAEEVTLKALLDGENIQEETLDLTEVKEWHVQFISKGVHKVQIMINDKLLKEYLFDCDKPDKITITENNMQDFE